jgi:hypothetical protein
VNEVVPPFKLEEIRARCEALQNALAEEYYESTAGLKNESNVSKIYQRYGDVVSKQAIEFVRRELEVAKAAAESAASPAAAFEREARRLRYLIEFQTDEFIGSELRSIIDEILTRESAARIRLGSGPGAEEIAFRKAQLEVANCPDRARREALERASLAVVGELTPLFAERIGIERGIARTFAHPTYVDLWRAVSGIDLAELDRKMQGFLARTQDMYREAMGWVVRKRLGVSLEDARRHDLHWLFRGNEFDDLFPKGDVVPVARRFLEEMGVDISAGGNVRFDLEPRERKSARAFCATLEVPRRIMLVLAPEGGRRDWQQFMHELGHALHYGYTSPEEPYEFRRLGDTSLSETYAFLFQYLLIDRGWLKRCLGMQKPKAFLFLANLEKLTYLRRYAAKLDADGKLVREAVEPLEGGISPLSLAIHQPIHQPDSEVEGRVAIGYYDSPAVEIYNASTLKREVVLDTSAITSTFDTANSDEMMKHNLGRVAWFGERWFPTFCSRSNRPAGCPTRVFLVGAVLSPRREYSRQQAERAHGECQRTVPTMKAHSITVPGSALK